jgi:hypothetical protein
MNQVECKSHVSMNLNKKIMEIKKIENRKSKGGN